MPTHPTTAPTHEAFLATRNFGSLDGLRALSIIAVVWHHTHPGFGWIATRRGFLGVDLFFVISGFLIVTLLLRERHRRRTIALGAFYARRFLRIFPIYYAVLLVHLAASMLMHGDQAAAIRHDLPYAFLYVSNWVHLQGMLSITWSLATEEQFYCVWPALERCGPRIARFALAAALLAFITIQLGAAHAGMFTGMPGFLRETSFTPILMGVALAHAVDSPSVFARVAPMLGHRVAAPMVLVLLIVLCSLPLENISGALRLAIHGAMVLLVATCVVREDHGLAKVLRFRPLARIGVVSYGIYLLHLLVLHFTTTVLHGTGITDPTTLFLVTLAAAWLAAEASYRFFEGPFLRWKDRWRR